MTHNINWNNLVGRVEKLNMLVYVEEDDKYDSRTVRPRPEEIEKACSLIREFIEKASHIPVPKLGLSESGCISFEWNDSISLSHAGLGDSIYWFIRHGEKPISRYHSNTEVVDAIVSALPKTKGRTHFYNRRRVNGKTVITHTPFHMASSTVASINCEDVNSGLEVEQFFVRYFSFEIDEDDNVIGIYLPYFKPRGDCLCMMHEDGCMTSTGEYWQSESGCLTKTEEKKLQEDMESLYTYVIPHNPFKFSEKDDEEDCEDIDYADGDEEYPIAN